MSRMEVNKLDAFLYVWGNQNVYYLAGVDPKKQGIVRKARKPMMMRFFKRTAEGKLSWVGTQFPTQSDAQQAEMSLADYEDFVYGAGYLHLADPTKHWKKVEKEQTRLVKILNRTDRLEVEGSHVDLKMRVKGRKWVSCHGTENFPDGEIFTSPHEDSMEGFINFTYPAHYDGRVVTGVRLDFKKGKVVKETAEKNLDYLKAMLNVDKGGRRVGEFAIGTNYQIKRATGNTLFDEKIGGSCHMAVGASIPEAGGKNKSAIHWDMVCDLKKDGEIKADGKVIYRKGKFVI
jgi:aminopeptidase